MDAVAPTNHTRPLPLPSPSQIQTFDGEFRLQVSFHDIAVVWHSRMIWEDVLADWFMVEGPMCTILSSLVLTVHNGDTFWSLLAPALVSFDDAVAVPSQRTLEHLLTDLHVRK